MNKLPVLISIPHGGTEIPEELKERVGLTRLELFDDSDACTREIYDLGDSVAEVITTDIARAIVDVGRDSDDLPPSNPDGVVKTKTCYGREVYKNGRQLTDELVSEVLNRYYYPYHERIHLAVQRQDIRLALDCHSMAAVGPEISPDQGKKRPGICLGNINGESCSYDLVDRLAECFQQFFSTEIITTNKPFAGGYITKKYGMNPLPWIQVELNRGLYLSRPWFDTNSLKVDHTRLMELQSKFKEALIGFFESWPEK
ncbi:N-formylglutamate amidohydrolase [Gemmatimonadota bacterium]